MDGIHFDDLTRSLAAGTTRRAGLKAALGGLLGIAALPAAVGEAKKKKKRSKLECSEATPCPAGMFCADPFGDGKGQCFCSATRQPPCGTECCTSDQACSVASGSARCTCQSDGRPACNGACCTEGNACAAGSCCPELRACGTVCCGEGRECRNAQCLVPNGACRVRGDSCNIQGQQCCGMLTCHAYDRYDARCK